MPFTVDDGCEVLTPYRHPWHQCMEVLVRKTLYVWPLCMQRENVNTGVLLYSYSIKLRCHGASISKHADNKSIHNGTLYVCTARLKFSVWVIGWRVRAHINVPSCGLVMRGKKTNTCAWETETDNEPMKSPLRRGQGGRSGSLRAYLIRAWVTRELNQITSFPWQLSQFPPFPFTSVINRKGNGAKLPLSDEIYMSPCLFLF